MKAIRPSELGRGEYAMLGGELLRNVSWPFATIVQVLYRDYEGGCETITRQTPDPAGQKITYSRYDILRN